MKLLNKILFHLGSFITKISVGGNYKFSIHQHDCSNCEFVGGFLSEHKFVKNDVYICKVSKSIVVRFSDNPPAYISQDYNSVKDPNSPKFTLIQKALELYGDKIRRKI